MMNWLYYLLEANLYLAAFYGFYRLFLHKETFYSLNRYYLIVTTLIAFVLPVLQISYLSGLLNSSTTIQTTQKISGAAQDLAVIKFITTGYLMVSSIFLIKLAFNLYRIISITIKARKQRHGKVIHVELKDTDTAFSFFNLLFVNPLSIQRDTILKHEMVHISQKHSLDVLFFEVVQVLNWFNPVAWLIKKDIRLVHEYIADDITTNTVSQKYEYAMFLIQNSFGVIHNPVTNQMFNQSILKRRINMLNQKRSKERARLKMLFVLPIMGGMLCASTMAFTKNYAMVDLYPAQYTTGDLPLQDTTKTKMSKIKMHKQVPPPPPTPPLAPPPPPVEPAPKKVKQPKAQMP
jgi:hypothetical protein